jgi:hypothetical protein
VVVTTSAYHQSGSPWTRILTLKINLPLPAKACENFLDLKIVNCLNLLINALFNIRSTQNKHKLVIGAVTQVSNYDAAQLNNILGRKTNGEDARAAEYQKSYLAPGEVEKVKEVPSDGTVTNTMSVILP